MAANCCSFFFVIFYAKFGTDSQRFETELRAKWSWHRNWFTARGMGWSGRGGAGRQAGREGKQLTCVLKLFNSLIKVCGRNRLGAAWKAVWQSACKSHRRRHVTADELQSLFAVTVTVRRAGEWRALSLSSCLSFSLSLAASRCLCLFACSQLHLVVNCIMHIYGWASS